MDLEPGRPVFLEELVQAPSQYVEKTVRVTGTLHSYNPTTDRAELVDNQYLLIIDTQLLGIQQYHNGQTYQFIGTIASTSKNKVAQPENLFDDAQFSLEIVLKARVLKLADGLDMAVYRKSVDALRQLTQSTE